MRREVLAGTYVPPRERAKQVATVADLAKRWLATQVATARNEKGHVLATRRVEIYLIPAMGAKKVDEVRPEDLQRHRLALEAHKREDGRKLSVETIRHLLSDCRAMWLWAVGRDHVARSPLPRKLLPKPPATRRPSGSRRSRVPTGSLAGS